MLTKNLETEENRAFWKHVEDVAEQVRHWPKWTGGEGVEPLQCPSCGQKLPKGKE